MACKIEDASKIKASQADRWIRETKNDVIGGEVANLIARSPLATKKMRQWMKAKREITANAGWCMMGVLAPDENGLLSDDELLEDVGQIQKSIHGAPNRVRYSMNNALIAIGMRNEKLKKIAIAAARKIGKVDVDHGDTNCKTPDAAAYILKTHERKKSRAKGKKKAAPRAKKTAKKK